ncbi:lysine biosynthesis protein LysX [Candidatus Bathyarchaeota archaeon]|nr:lysine biosynthesis protein LysX [Candidatus Bathyarchaeota archaeon]
MNQIGLVYDRIRWEEKVLMDSSKRLGLNLKMIDSKEVCFDTLEDPAKVEEAFGNVVLQRCISYFRGLHITAILENFGLRVINPFSVSLLCGNKLFTTLALIKAGVPIPRTLVAFTNRGALKALEALGYPAVLKPVVGSWGRLVALIRDKDSAQALVESREEMQNSLMQIYYLQEYIKRPPRDIRTLTIGEEVVAAAYRYSAEDDWRTNVARGGRTEPCPITDELEDFAIRASRAVGGGVLAVDCMESPDGIVIHEVNNTPEFKGLYSATKIDIPEKIIEYAIKVMKK